MRALTEDDIRKISKDTMGRVGDVVRNAAAVNVSQRIKSLGIKPEDLPAGTADAAVEDQCGVILGRLVETSIAVMQDVLKPAPRARKKKPVTKKKARAKR